MDYCNFGTEYCINGVWGRTKNGYFYNQQDDLHLLRELDIKSETGKYYAACRNHQYEEGLVFKDVSRKQPVPYVPEHIRKLAQFKRGDTVWVQIGSTWKQVTFHSVDTVGICTLIAKYTERGEVLIDDILFKREVFLKPPFDF